ncbi:M15 family metallopeptidase [Leptotrichia trevisanii]|uniref:D-alanyl-D-alanine carboxypeptidase-like core domain-containing protein n=1 Tax=Leptotrichia trevisanii TaxID=109328 RepID=A0A510K1T1_9FUSO|nr:M15 family metallopeptidase [Leptotrichia trevisanii]BBM45628.1 hypothetical protein JMUB3870_1748 [Leptotrichia trevisanii]
MGNKNVLNQTNRTILFEEINPEKMDILTLINDARDMDSLDDENIIEINRHLLVGSFEEFLEKLDPRIRCTVKHLINFMEDKYKVRMRVTDGYRSHAQQNELYKKGRTTKGLVVTWVKAGYSYHNYGLAIDVCTIENGKAYWREKDYKLFNNEAVKFGAEWGIKFKDKPHFQFRFGKTASQHYQDYKDRGNKLSYTP